MSRPVFLQIAFLALTAMASAFDLVFFADPRGCYGFLPHIMCENVEAGKCCHAANPFCQSLCVGTDRITATTIFANGSDCVQDDAAKDYNSCTKSDRCQLFLPPGLDISDGCSAKWHLGEPNPDPNLPPSVPSLHPVPPRAPAEGQCVDPNVLAYDDGLGLRRIRIPDGEFGSVMEAYSRGDFGALSRYQTHD